MGGWGCHIRRSGATSEKEEEEYFFPLIPHQVQKHKQTPYFRGVTISCNNYSSCSHTESQNFVSISGEKGGGERRRKFAFDNLRRW